jgi:hypothetical protein
LWRATDSTDNSATCTQTIEVVDTVPPTIIGDVPETITPPDAPVAFVATAEDSCDGAPFVVITSYDCFKFTKKGKRIDKTESCIVNLDNDMISILDTGGVGTTVAWKAAATDACGNTSSRSFQTQVVIPGRSRR